MVGASCCLNRRARSVAPRPGVRTSGEIHVGTVKPEEKARQEIDRQLIDCSWKVQDHCEMNLSVGLRPVVLPLQMDPVC